MKIFNMKVSYPVTKNASKWPQYVAVTIASLSVVINGIQIGWSSPSMPKITSNESQLISNITAGEVSVIYLMQTTGSVIGNPLGVNLIGAFGPKWLLVFTSIPYVIASILTFLATTPAQLIIARLVSGVGESSVYVGMSVYIGEVAEPAIRGGLGGSISIALFLGILIINILGSYLTVKTTAIVVGSFPIMFALAFIWMPNSPYYLLMKNRRGEAIKALQRLRNLENVEKELAVIEDAIERQTREVGTWLELITVKSNRKAMSIMFGLRSFQQLSGITVIIFYTQTIFKESNMKMDPSTASIIFCTVQVAVMVVGSSLLDKLGRRPMMMASAIGCGISLAFIGTYFYFLENGYDVSNVQWVPITALICFIIPYGMGIGPIPSLMLGELFAVNIKSKAICVSMTSFCILGVLLTKVFQILDENLGMFAGFWLFSFCCFAASLFTYFCLPETKGKTLEEIQKWMRGES